MALTCLCSYQHEKEIGKSLSTFHSFTGNQDAFTSDLVLLLHHELHGFEIQQLAHVSFLLCKLAESMAGYISASLCMLINTTGINSSVCFRDSPESFPSQSFEDPTSFLKSYFATF